MPAPATVMVRVLRAVHARRIVNLPAPRLRAGVGAALQHAVLAHDDGVRAGGEQVGAHAVPVGLHLQRMPDGRGMVNLDLERRRRGCRSS